MAKTPLFRAVSRLIRAAHSANKNDFSRNQIESLVGAKRENLINRREFIAGAAALGIVGGLAKRASAAPPTGNLVIVGAGIAGLTTAYRLHQSGVASEIYEASSRVGGRMWTKSQFNADGMYVDLGAELVDSDNLDLIDLCKELSVPLGTFADEEAGLTSEIYYAGGRIRTEAEIIAAFQPLAALLAVDMAKISPDGVLTIPNYNNTISADAIALDHLSLHDYLYSKQNQIDPMLLDIINNAYVGEYGRETEEQSALNLLVLASDDTSDGMNLFGSSDEVMRILGGSGTLPQVLADSLKSEVPIYTDSRLIGIRDKGTYFTLVFSTPAGIIEKNATQVVITIPFSVLREVEGIFSLGLTPAKTQSIQQLGYGTNSKLMMGFTQRFWHTASATVPASRGEIFSDLRRTQEFWDTSRLQKGSSGILTSFTGGISGATAHPGDLSGTLSELDRIYSGTQATQQFDGNELTKSWILSPFQRGSYACPMPGQYTSFLGSEGEPELGGRLLFAGEHCSLDFQGFMNGAVETGNAVAKMITSQRLG